jgi:hypothetical protein
MGKDIDPTLNKHYVEMIEGAPECSAKLHSGRFWIDAEIELTPTRRQVHLLFGLLPTRTSPRPPPALVGKRKVSNP